MILKFLLQKPLSRKEEIFQALQADPQRLEMILESLKKEGFIVKKGIRYTIAE